MVATLSFVQESTNYFRDEMRFCSFSHRVLLCAKDWSLNGFCYRGNGHIGAKLPRCPAMGETVVP
jgi:hypothetical protein